MNPVARPVTCSPAALAVLVGRRSPSPPSPAGRSPPRRPASTTPAGRGARPATSWSPPTIWRRVDALAGRGRRATAPGAGGGRRRPRRPCPPDATARQHVAAGEVLVERRRRRLRRPAGPDPRRLGGRRRRRGRAVGAAVGDPVAPVSGGVVLAPDAVVVGSRRRGGARRRARRRGAAGRPGRGDRRARAAPGPVSDAVSASRWRRSRARRPDGRRGRCTNGMKLCVRHEAQRAPHGEPAGDAGRDDADEHRRHEALRDAVRSTGTASCAGTGRSRRTRRWCVVDLEGAEGDCWPVDQRAEPGTVQWSPDGSMVAFDGRIDRMSGSTPTSGSSTSSRARS